MTNIVVQKDVNETFGYLDIVMPESKAEKISLLFEELGIDYEIDNTDNHNAYIRIFSNIVEIEEI